MSLFFLFCVAAFGDQGYEVDAAIGVQGMELMVYKEMDPMVCKEMEVML
jgi:hypothetical protein